MSIGVEAKVADGDLTLFGNMGGHHRYKLQACPLLNQGESICSTSKDVAEIKEAAGENVGIFVARGDGPSQGVMMEVMKREGWFLGERKDLE